MGNDWTARNCQRNYLDIISIAGRDFFVLICGMVNFSSIPICSGPVDGDVTKLHDRLEFQQISLNASNYMHPNLIPGAKPRKIS